MSQNEKTPRVRIPRRSAPATADVDRQDQQEEDWIARFRATHYTGDPPPEGDTDDSAARAVDQEPAAPASAPVRAQARRVEPVAQAAVTEPTPAPTADVPATQPWHTRLQDRTATPQTELTPLPSLFDWSSLTTPQLATVAPVAETEPAEPAPAAIADPVDFFAEEPAAPAVSAAPVAEPAAPVAEPAAPVDYFAAEPATPEVVADVAAESAPAEPTAEEAAVVFTESVPAAPGAPEQAVAEPDSPHSSVTPAETFWTVTPSEPAAVLPPVATAPEVSQLTAQEQWDQQQAAELQAGAAYPWGLAEDLHEQPSGPARPSWMTDAAAAPLSDDAWMARFSEAASQPAQPPAEAAPLPTAAQSGSAISDDEWMARFGGGKTLNPPAPEPQPPTTVETPLRQIEAPRKMVPAAPAVPPGQASHLYLDWDALAKDNEAEEARVAEEQALEQQRIAAQRAAVEQQRETQRAATEQAEAAARRRRRRQQQEAEDGEWIAKLRSERFDAEAEAKPAAIEKHKPEPEPETKGLFAGRGKPRDKDHTKERELPVYAATPAPLSTVPDPVPGERAVTPYTYGGALATATNDETAAAISRITQQFSAAGVRPVEPVVIINQGGGQGRSNPLGWVVIAATLVIVGFLFAIGGLGWLVSKLSGAPTSITITMPSPVVATVVVPGQAPAQPAQPAQPDAPVAPAAAALTLNGKARVRTEGGAPANVRAEPGLDAQLLTKLDNGTAVILTEGPLVKSGNRWWKVSAPNTEGWVAESLLTPEP